MTKSKVSALRSISTTMGNASPPPAGAGEWNYRILLHPFQNNLRNIIYTVQHLPVGETEHRKTHCLKVTVFLPIPFSSFFRLVRNTVYLYDKT
jgi:hypothetical protein